MKTKLTVYYWPQFLKDAYYRIVPLLKPHSHKYSHIWSPPRGGLSLGQILAYELSFKYYPKPPDSASTLIVDNKTLSQFPKNDTFTIFYNKSACIRPTYPALYEQAEDEWIFFPWENPEDLDDMPEGIRTLITPEVIKKLREF